MSKIVQNIRLSLPFSQRFDDFKTSINVKWTGSNYNIAALIQILIWENYMLSSIPGANTDVIKATKERFMNNSKCSEDIKERCGYLLQQLKIDRILIIWLQNLTGRAMDTIPKCPQQVFDLFISFMAEMEDRATNECGTHENVSLMKNVILLAKQAFDIEWNGEKDGVKIVAHPVMLTLPIVLRTSLPSDHSLFLSQTEFTEAINYFNTFANLSNPIGDNERLYTDVRRHLATTKDKHLSFCTGESVWKTPFYGALPKELNTGFSTLEWRCNEIEEATRHLDTLNAEWNTSLHFENVDSAMESLCSGDSNDTVELSECLSSARDQVNCEQDSSKGGNARIGYQTDQKVLQEMSDSSCSSASEDEEDEENEDKQSESTNNEKTSNQEIESKITNRESPSRCPQSPLFRVDEKNNPRSPKLMANKSNPNSPKRMANKSSVRESDSERESGSDSSDNDDDNKVNDAKVTNTNVEIAAKSDNETTGKGGNLSGDDSDTSASSESSCTSDSVTSTSSSDCQSDVEIGIRQKRKKSKKSKRSHKMSDSYSKKMRKSDNNSDSDDDDDESERKRREVERQKKIKEQQMEEMIERERKQKAEEEKIEI